MTSCLIVSSLAKSIDALGSLVKNSGIQQVETAKSASEARRFIQSKSYDVVVINTPLKDEFGHDLAFTITENTDSGVVMLVKNELLEEISSKLCDYGTLCIGKPMDRSLFEQGVHLALAMHRRIAAIAKKNSILQEKMDELRIVSRAKCCLIENRGMSENEAHRYIEKKAMDQRETKVKVAQAILAKYE